MGHTLCRDAKQDEHITINTNTSPKTQCIRKAIFKRITPHHRAMYIEEFARLLTRTMNLNGLYKCPTPMKTRTIWRKHRMDVVQQKVSPNTFAWASQNFDVEANVLISHTYMQLKANLRVSAIQSAANPTPATRGHPYCEVTSMQMRAHPHQLQAACWVVRPTTRRISQRSQLYELATCREKQCPTRMGQLES